MQAPAILAHLLIAALCLGSPASAQPISYTLVAAEGPKPAPRDDGTIAYEPAGRRIFLFGGAGDAEKNDLWAFSLAQRRWTELQPEGGPPPPRFGHTLVVDSRRQRLILFGGQAGEFFNDTWSYDWARNRWTQLVTTGAAVPSRRYGHSAIYDPTRDRMIVSHGFTNAGRFDDTWSLDLATNTWRDISPAGGRPLRRCLHHATYDAVGDQMLLYGGCSSGAGPCPQGDLWSFDLASHRWTEITGAAKPPAREHYGTAFDSTRQRMVVFGGAGPAKLNDTWEFDPRTRTWRELAIAGASPGPRSRHEGAFASDRGVTYFFGGSTPTARTNELWMLGPGFVTTPPPELSRAGAVNAFSGIGDAVAPGEIVSLYGSGLGPLDGIALGLDPLTGLLPTSGPGVSVTFNGVAAPLFFVSSTQINVQAPYELQGSAEAAIEIIVNGAASGPVTIPVAPTHPGLYPQAFHADGSPVTTQSPGVAGETIVLFATGLGPTTPASRTGAIPTAGVYPEPLAAVRLTIGGRPAELLFKGQAPGTVGVTQLNARIPEGFPVREAASAILRVGEADSQSGVLIPVR